MWVFEGVMVICAKPPLLHSPDVLIKMFANSIAVLNQQTMERTDNVHCYQTQLPGCLVLGRQETCVSFSVKSSLNTQARFWVCGEWNRP